MTRPILGAVIEGRVLCNDCAPFDLTAQKRKGVTRIYGVRPRQEVCYVCDTRLGVTEKCNCGAHATFAKREAARGIVVITHRCLRCWERKLKNPDPKCPECRGTGWLRNGEPYAWRTT